MKVGVIGAGTMGQGIAKAFAQVEGYEVALCDIKQEWADGGKAKIQKGYARLVEKGKMTQEAVDAILAKITPGLKEDLCADCDLIVEAAFEDEKTKNVFLAILRDIKKDMDNREQPGEAVTAAMFQTMQETMKDHQQELLSMDDVTAMIAGQIGKFLPMDEETAEQFRQLAKRMMEQVGK